MTLRKKGAILPILTARGSVKHNIYNKYCYDTINIPFTFLPACLHEYGLELSA